MDWTDVEAQLRQRVLDVCQHLLPKGKRNGNEWECGSIEGEAGKSFKVSLSPGKAGFWTDFAGGGGGKNLMQLWCQARNLPFKLAIGEAKAFLGIRDDFDKRIKQYAPNGDTRPEVGSYEQVARTWAQCRPLTEGGPVWEYLVVTRRIEPQVLGWFDVREVISNGQWVMVFPYYAAPGDDTAPAVLKGADTPEWLKFEALLRGANGKKREWTSPGPEKCLWGMQLAKLPMFANSRHVLICEGEKDALTWATYGCAVKGILPVSVPFGAKWRGQDKGRPSPNREWIERGWDWLQGFETVYVAMDGDAAGQRAAVDIITEIGPRRCRLVTLPEK
jgi:twinkle protein